MEKELCFYIEYKSLYLDQVLVDYMDVPIFFLCKSGNQFYIALCTDIDELRYIVEELSNLDVYRLLHGKISMRDVFLSHEEYWEIISGEEISSDIVIKQTLDCIDSSVLPEENAYFKILTEEIQLYVEEFDKDFFGGKYSQISDERLDLDGRSMFEPFDVFSDGEVICTDLNGYSFRIYVKQAPEIALDSNGILYMPFAEQGGALSPYSKSDWYNYSDDMVYAAV